MDLFWQQVQKFRARRWSGIALLVVLAVVLWVLQEEMARPRATNASLARIPAKNGVVPVGESFFSWPHALRAPRKINRNPFYSPAIDQFLVQEKLERLAAKKAAEARAVVKQTRAKPRAPVKPPPPKTRKVVLVYRGIMIRPDQTVLALIENRTDGHTHFYRQNAPLVGMSVHGIERDKLVLTSHGGSNHVIRVDAPTTFKEVLTNGR